jgi:hypothetical protein
LGGSASTFVRDLQGAVDNLAALLRAARPDQCSGDEALVVTSLFSDVERIAASGMALFTPVVIQNGSYAKSGHGSPKEWMGSLSGSSAAAAKGRLAAAARAAGDPRLTEALHEGELSSAQLDVVAQAAAEAPESTGPLLDLLDRGASHQELSDTVAGLRAAHRSREDERVREDRVHAHRHFRWRQDPAGGIRGEFSCDEVAWARVAPLLEQKTRARWKAAGDGRSSYDAHRLDAVIELLGASGGSGGGARAHAVVLIDAAALRRGTTEGDELCEIEGIGPVSVASATELIGEGGLTYLVREGIDIKTVTKRSRVVAACIDTALLVRDRRCARPGCGKRFGLERDHRVVDYRDGGPTELKNLARLCPECHDLKTHGGWRLEGEPGNFKWIAPAQPKSAQYIARASRIAAARAKAKRNNPLQT